MLEENEPRFQGSDDDEFTAVNLDSSVLEQIPHDVFSTLFLAAVEEFYKEWMEEKDAKLPDFEKALRRAKIEGVAPQI